ncbi:MAG TPA: response regulator [Synechococcales cyanobacterium M55_K2018_004]|nr:response regulator [Synechococcales cyanobacterium M55_K2018_004]
MHKIYPAAEATQCQGNILIVDDTPDNLQLLSKILSLKGYDVRAVTSGSMALTVVKASPPEIILLDIRMPQMDGYEVCRLLKSDPATRYIPVIFLSALTEIEDKTDAFDVGGVDYITKPFRMAEVVARVKTHLTLWRLQRTLEQQNQRFQQELLERQYAMGDRSRVGQRVLKTVTARLQGEPDPSPEFLTEVAILVVSLTNGAQLAKPLAADEWIQCLNRVHCEIDEWARIYDVDLIRANGTEWLVAAGALQPREDYGTAIADFAIALHTSLAKPYSSKSQPLQVQIGIHAGAVVAGVVGAQRLTYDLWGETVDLAQRVHRQGTPGKILVSAALYPHLQKRYLLEEQGRIEQGSSGALQTYWLKAKRK